MYRTAQTINDCLRWYAQTQASFAHYIALQPSQGGQPIGALRLRFGGNFLRRPAVLLLAGLHGNELMLPDILVDFVERLAFTPGDWNITQGSNTRVIKTWPLSVLDSIRQSLDIVVLPLANPDGREHVLSNQANAFNMGRKNGTSIEPPWVGVDLNRNFPLPANHGVQQTGSLSPAPHVGPSLPSHETYRGPSPLSEIESKNVDRLLSMYPFECMIDLHMNAQMVLYSWGHAPSQHLKSLQHDFMPADDLAKLASIGAATARAMSDVGSDTTSGGMSVDSMTYRAGDIYRTYGKAPGSALDYARDSTRDRPQVVYGFCLELGRASIELPQVLPADVLETYTPQGFTGMLTILEACAQGVFRAPARVRVADDKRRLVGLYESIVKDSVRKDKPLLRLAPGP